MNASSRNPRNGAIHAMLVSPQAEDHRALAHIFQHTRWHLHAATTLQEALALLSEHPISVVLSDTRVGDDSWRELLTRLQAADRCQRLIVCSGEPDDHLWAEVLNEGGFDCLLKPFRDREIYQAISDAHQSRTNELQRRSLTALATATRKPAGQATPQSQATTAGAR